MSSNLQSKVFVSAIALAFFLVGVPASALEPCDESEIVVLEDCTQIEVTPTCWCGADLDTRESVDISLAIIDDHECTTAGDDACVGICDPDAELDYDPADLVILDVTPRRGQARRGNATPGPNKGFAAAACLDCPGTDVDAILFAKKKNSHFDVVIGLEGDPDEIKDKVGVNLHTQACEDEPEP